MKAVRATLVLLLVALALCFAPSFSRAEDEAVEVKDDAAADEGDDAVEEEAEAEEEAEDPSTPRASLVFRREVDTEHWGAMAVDQEVTVKLSLFNAGKGDAYETRVVDNWAADSFRIAEGEKEVSFDVIPAGETVTAELKVVPTSEGTVTPFRATVAYKPTPRGAVQTGFSTPMVAHTVYDAATYAKITTKHSFEYGVFGGGLALLVLMPLFLYNQAKTAMEGKDKAQ